MEHLDTILANLITIEISYESIRRNASFCGRRGFTVSGVQSWNFYKTMGYSGNWETRRYWGVGSDRNCENSTWESTYTETWYGTRTRICGSSAESGFTGYDWHRIDRYGSETSGTVSGPNSDSRFDIISETQAILTDPGTCDVTYGSQYFNHYEGTIYQTLSNPDTEAEALERATGIPGTQATSYWELRGSSASTGFVQQSCSYTIKLGLVRPGITYIVTLTIRRRIVYSANSGIPDGEWEPVTVSPEIISFTDSDPKWDSTNLTYTLPTVDLPLIEGWEYEIFESRVTTV